MEQLACTQKQASKMLGVSVSTIGRYIKDDIVNYTKIGTRTLINIKSIYELMGENEPITVDIKEEYYKLFSELTWKNGKKLVYQLNYKEFFYLKYLGYSFFIFE